MKRGILSLSIWLVALASFWPSEAFALPSWSRKYKVSCTTCHAPTFARLNDYGERYAWNGYQDPDSDVSDGDAQGKTQYGDRLFLDSDIGKYLSVRLNMTPVQWTQNAAARGGTDARKGAKSDTLDFGTTNWFQFFVAGSIYKNVSIYLENEITVSTVKFEWYYMGFHNIADTKMLNFQVGRVGELVFAPYNDRLPQLPFVSGGIMRLKSSNGAGQASNDLRSARHGFQYYGYGGPFLWYAGINNGPTGDHPTDDPGYWIGARYLLSDGLSKDFASSSIGLHGSTGTDSKNSTLATKVENHYDRVMPSINVRYKDKVDVQAAYVIGHEDNWNLSEPNGVPPFSDERRVNYRGVRLVGSYFHTPQWAYSVHYDQYEETDNSTLLPKYQYLYFPVITFIPRENWRLSLYPGFDLDNTGKDSNTVALSVRCAF